MILGIDPGLSGAWALLGRDGKVIGCDELPVIRDLNTAWIDPVALSEQIIGCAGLSPQLPAGITAFVERVNSMPKQGVASSFTFGTSFGSVLAAVQALGVSMRLVRGGDWKRALGMTRPKGLETYDPKAVSLDKARLLFPGVRLDRKKDHNLADALLIAHYGLAVTLPKREAA